ncbi:MAG: histidine phosphatase family protein [Opitutaceae bacterium]|jgi:phosphohistidine phosphatase|nr:histidine phosphatase family protein [Opitutaceae bacterium]
MLLHLVRHAHAVEESEHPARPLSARGRTEAARLARFFLGNGCFAPAHVWHSPLARSRETADELARRLGWADSAVMVETSGLLPEDDPQEVAERLEIWPRDRGDLAIIGHEPHLSALASLLVRGREKPALFTLKKAAVLTLEPSKSVFKKNGFARWRVRWLLAPELLPPAPLPLAPAAASPQTLPPA